MAFPEDILDTKVEISINGVWTNVTDFVYRDRISIIRGSADQTNTNQPASCKLLFNNRDGRFSPRNPVGPYYGTLGRNTDILVSVLGGNRYLDIPGTGTCTTPDNATISITGDIDVRFDATLEDWTSSVNAAQSTIELMGKYNTTGNQRSWMLLTDGGELRLRWSADGTSTIEVASTVNLTPDATRRLAVRATLDVDNGAAGNTVTFYTAPTINGPWMQLGDPVVTAGTTSIFDSTAPLLVGDGSLEIGFAQPYGKVHAAELRSGIGGTVVANPDFSIPAKGVASFADAAGRTWTVATSGAGSINDQQNRFRGKVTAWPSRWETGGFDVWVPIEAKGDMRRLNQGQKALDSAMTRRIPSDPDILAYWPMEDGEAATSAGSPIDGVGQLQFLNDVDPAAHAGPDGSDSLPSFNENSSWHGIIPAAPIPLIADEWQAEWIVNIQQATSTMRTIQQISSTGTVITWRFLIDNGGARIEGYNRAGTALVAQSVALTQSEVINNWVRWQFFIVQDGANVDWTMVWIPIGATGGSFSGTYVGTVGRPSAVHGPAGLHADIAGLSWGHFAAFNNSISGIFNSADIGFAGEEAWTRFERLADEQGETVRLVGDPDTPAMGAQRPDLLLDLLQESADVDHGFLGESREANAALVFISKSAIYNQTPRLTLGYTDDGEVHAPLDPTDDDLNLRNAITASRERGGSGYAELATGTLSIADVGIYDTEVTFNTETDDVMDSYAGWELHLGTWDEERYPTVLVKLEAAPHLIGDAVSIDQGARIRITNARNTTTRTHIPPGDIDLLVLGYQETLSQYEWNLEFQCVPARPWDVGVLDHASSPVQRLDTDGSELAEALDTTETAVEVLTTTYPTWTDQGEDMPFDWLIGGEALRVLAPGGLVNSNPLFESDITGWTASGGTVARSTAQVHPEPIAIASALVTPTGGAAVTVSSANTDAGTVNPSGRYQATAWVYVPAGWNGLRLQVVWRDAAGTALSTSSGTTTNIAAGFWTQITETFTADAAASRCNVTVQQTGTPAATDVWYAWAVTVCRLKASLLYDEFGRTSTDTWGAADSAQAWTNSGGAAADYDVLTGFGRHINPATSVGHHSVVANTEGDSDLYCDITTAATSTGASQLAGVLARYTDLDNLYEARLEFTTANVINLTVRKRVAAVESQLGSTFVHWKAHVAGTSMRVRFQVIGTALKAKAWRVGDPEPDVWQVDTTDSALAGPGSVGVKSVRAAGNTNANAEFRFDNYEMANPQVYSVIRSANGIVKSHSSGAAVNLARPMYLAL